MPVTDLPSDAIRTSGLRKAFRIKNQSVEAVSGIDLTVAAGQIFGFLGPNGAGKTTTLRILTTLLPADAGEAFVAGADVRRRPQQVRRRIGYVGQLGGADASATGRENLLLQGRLYGMSAAQTARRTDELIEAFDLGAFADRTVRSYSGGQRRRLEVALGIMHRPPVLFLDEPTTGLDPQNRANLWDQLRELRGTGTTIFLTTHYLDEADQLSDRLAIIDHGTIVAEGTADELKSEIAGDVITLGADGLAERVLEHVRLQPYVREASIDGDVVRLYVDRGDAAVPQLLRTLDAAGLNPQAITLARPSLDDVFLRQTGRSLREEARPAA